MATKTYVLLSTIPTGNSPGQTPIKQCSALLENHLQCWNASAFVVKTLRDGKPFEYQLCRRHAMIEQALPPEDVKAFSTTSDATEVKIEAKPVEGIDNAKKTGTRVVADSKSSFTPAQTKQPELKDIQSEVDRKVSADATPAAKPLLSPKTTKPAAF